MGLGIYLKCTRMRCDLSLASSQLSSSAQPSLCRSWPPAKSMHKEPGQVTCARKATAGSGRHRVKPNQALDWVNPSTLHWQCAAVKSSTTDKRKPGGSFLLGSPQSSPHPTRSRWSLQAGCFFRLRVVVPWSSVAVPGEEEAVRHLGVPCACPAYRIC